MSNNNDNSASNDKLEIDKETKASSKDIQELSNNSNEENDYITPVSSLPDSNTSKPDVEESKDQKSNSLPITNEELTNNSTNDVDNTNVSSSNNTAISETEATIKQPRILREYSREILEAAFFVAGRPLSTRHLAQEFGANTREIRQMTRNLATSLRKYEGELQLTQLEYDSDYWVLHLEIEDNHLELLQNLLVSDIPKSVLHAPLTRAILTAVAFLQPCSQARVFKILSKQGGFIITTTQIEQELERLSKEGLIIANVAKSPIQFETTKRFAVEFGFEELSRIKLRNQLARWLGATEEDVGQSEPAEE